MSAKIKCPACNRIYAFKAELAGKSATCKCGHKIRFPELPAVATPRVAQEACPNCEAFMPPGDVLCTQCGYNRNTGRIVTGAAAGARRRVPTVRVSRGRVIPAWVKFSVATVGVLLVATAGWVVYQKMFESPQNTSPVQASATPATAGGAVEVPPVVAKETPVAAPTAKRYPARQFSSKVPFDVYVSLHDNTSDYVNPTLEATKAIEAIGRTPTDNPVDIPACDVWWVSANGAPLTDVVKEVKDQALPGLALPRSATNEDLALLKGLTGLQLLDLTWAQVTDAGLEHLQGMTQLQMLGLMGTQVTDAGLKQLNGLTGLQELNLSYTKVTDAGLANLKGLTRLQTLDLDGTKVTNTGLAQLKSLTGLQSLNLRGTEVTDAGLEHLKGLTSLQELDLAGTRVTDTGLEHLKGLTGLQHLELYNTAVTHAGLAQLKDLRSVVIISATGQLMVVGYEAKLLFTLSKETTAITGPLQADGTVDYVAATNERYGKGVAPENNGFVKYLAAVGTGDYVLSKNIRTRLLQMCGATETPAGAEVWEDYAAYMKRTSHLSDADAMKTWDELTAAGRAVWRQQEHANLAGYLQAQEASLAKIAEAAQCPQWYVPRVSREGRLSTTYTPFLSSALPLSLCARAIQRGSSRDVVGFLKDIKTVRMLARHMGRNGDSIGCMFGQSLESRAMEAMAAVAASGALTEAQCKTVAQALNEVGAMPPLVECVDCDDRWRVLDAVQWLSRGTVKLRLVTSLAGSMDEVELSGQLDVKEVQWDTVLRRVNAFMDESVAAMSKVDSVEMRKACRNLEDRLEAIRKEVQAGRQDASKAANETPAAYTDRITKALLTHMMPGVRRGEFERQTAQQTDMVRVVVAAAQVKAASGKWPATQAELVPAVLKELPKDMYSEGGALPFKYVVKPNGVRVYSVGPNGKDDGGTRDGTAKDDLAVGAEAEAASQRSPAGNNPKRPPVKLALEGVKPVLEAQFAAGAATQQVTLRAPATGRYFCLESLDTQGGNKFAAVAELDLLGKGGWPLSRDGWTIAYADSEEQIRENGRAENAIDGKAATYWHTQWSDAQPDHPHRLILDLGQSQTITAFRYIPPAGADNVGGRIKNYRIYIGDTLVQK